MPAAKRGTRRPLLYLGSVMGPGPPARAHCVDAHNTHVLPPPRPDLPVLGVELDGLQQARTTTHAP